MTEIPDADAMKAFNANIAEEFRANGGKVTGQFANADLLLLTTTGAKSGQPGSPRWPISRLTAG